MVMTVIFACVGVLVGGGTGLALWSERVRWKMLGMLCAGGGIGLLIGVIGCLLLLSTRWLFL